MNPPGTVAGTVVPGGLVCGGLSRRPPLPPRVRAGPAGVLSEAGRYVRGARPGCRAVGGDRNVRSGRKPTGGRLPPYEPPGEDPALACRAGMSAGRDDCRFVPPDPPHSVLALLTVDGAECVWR